MKRSGSSVARSEAGHEHGSDQDPMTCCPSLSNLCGTGAVPCGEAWHAGEHLAVGISPSLQDGAELIASL
jgi:hypothetical protein